MVCQDCKFYSEEKGGICGLGIDCKDIQTCDFKVVGKPLLVLLEEGSRWEFEPGNSIAQAPKDIKGLYYYHRKHITKPKNNRLVIVILLLDKRLYSEISILEKIVPKLTTKKIKLEIELEKGTAAKITISWTESKREAFLQKKAKKGRVIK